MKKQFFIVISIIFYTFCQTNAQIVFKTDKREIHKGDSVLLTWSVDVKKVLSISLDNYASNCANVGSMYVKPDTTMSFKLVVKTKKEDLKKTVFVEVYEPSFKKIELPAKATDEQLIKINWQAVNTEYVEIVGITKNLEPTGDTAIYMKKTSPLIFVCHNKFEITDTIVKNINITILETINLPDSVFYGENSFITWKYKTMKKIIVDGDINEYELVDTLKFNIKTSKTFKFFVIKTNGDTLKIEKLVRVVSPIKSFYMPKMVYKGSSALLKWEVVEGFTANIVDIKTNIPAKGDVSVTPSEQNLYTLEVKEKNKVIFTKKISTRVVSPIILFDVPEIAYSNNKEDIKWNVANGYDVNISNIGENLKSTDVYKFMPAVNQTFTLTVKKDGNIVETLDKKMQVMNRREFATKTISYDAMTPKIPFDLEIFAIDNSKYPDEVSVSFLVVDTMGRYILDLDFDKHKDILNRVVEKIDEKDFPVKDYKIKEFKNQVAIPYDISMTLDYSGSMTDNIKILEEAAKDFINKKDNTDNINVFKFDNSLVQDCDFSTDINYLIKNTTFNGLDTLGGSTALYAGADYAMQSFTTSKNQKILLLFTDGEENSSFQYFGKFATSANDIVKNANKENVKIFVVAFGVGVNNDVLKKIAWLTGGSFYSVQRKSDINKVFKEMPIIMRNYYVLTFKPKNKDGFHEVEMFYDDEKNKEVSTNYSFYTGKDYNIDEFDSPKVENSYWKKSLNTLGTYKPISVPQAVAFFDFDKSELQDEYKAGLDVYADFLNKFPKSIAVIFGHTDLKGSDDYCMELSEKRATTVYNYLISKGIDKSRLSLVPCGKTEPIWNPDAEEWKAHENRRIEIMLAE